MRFRKFRLILTLLFLGACGWTSLPGGDDSERTEERQIMDHKLSHSQDILASLGEGRFFGDGRERRGTHGSHRGAVGRQ